MSAISIQNISKTYPPPFPRVRKFFGLRVKESVEALRNVSLEIEKGEIFGLIGKNGAGKTTLTKVIATLVQPTSGKVLVNGFDSVNNDVKVRSLVGLATAEERSFYWRLTSMQNLLFFARLYGMSDKVATKRIGRLFKQLDLTDLAKRRFSDLSTGNKQKLAVARALLADPPILLLDEPTRSLDPLAASDMRKLIGAIEGVSILLTSHNLSEIEELCNRVAIIANGSIRAVDTPKSLRGSHRQTQKVKINLKGSLKDNLITLNKLDGFELQEKDDEITLTFNRDSDDDLLGKTVSELNGQGARILDVETEKATLLDVLESYE
ncbi:MAG: ABC transporter ATP-binding protein [Pyrinomonadaceae bacterium]|nr:ABC transporter ATP-binding protein [Pyrinomonadaceae bacterium]